MNRHAYLIMAHNHFDFLKDLLLRLDDPRNDIYLHVDAAASDFHPEEFTNLLSSSRLFLTDRLRVHWGGYSQIAAELTLLRAASREQEGCQRPETPCRTRYQRRYESAPGFSGEDQSRTADGSRDNVPGKRP